MGRALTLEEELKLLFLQEDKLKRKLAANQTLIKQKARDYSKRHGYLFPLAMEKVRRSVLLVG